MLTAMTDCPASWAGWLQLLPAHSTDRKPQPVLRVGINENQCSGARKSTSETRQSWNPLLNARPLRTFWESFAFCCLPVCYPAEGEKERREWCRWQNGVRNPRIVRQLMITAGYWRGQSNSRDWPSALLNHTGPVGPAHALTAIDHRQVQSCTLLCGRVFAHFASCVTPYTCARH